MYNAFVNRVLLEEGAPRAILTDNGTEFTDKTLKDLMEWLKVHFQFSPPYHPQSNQTERSNRYIVELLRCMVHAPDARKRDWNKYIRYVEFAIRRTPIPGTNLTPFEVMRGREPLLPNDLALADERTPPDVTHAEHVKELHKTLKQAEKMVTSARERVMAKNKDLQDLSRKHITFEIGELVRLWRAQHSSKGDAAKLKLRNATYRVIGRDGDRYDLEHTEHPEIVRKNTSVSHIARWRGPLPSTVTHTTASPAPARASTRRQSDTPADDSTTPDAQGVLWDKLKQNKVCCFVFKGEQPSFLRTAEVLAISGQAIR